MPVQSGEDHYTARLTWAQVREIRSIVKTAHETGRSHPTYKELGLKYKVSAPMICGIVKGDKWPERNDPARART